MEHKKAEIYLIKLKTMVKVGQKFPLFLSASLPKNKMLNKIEGELLQCLHQEGFMLSVTVL